MELYPLPASLHIYYLTDLVIVPKTTLHFFLLYNLLSFLVITEVLNLLQFLQLIKDLARVHFSLDCLRDCCKIIHQLALFQNFVPNTGLISLIHPLLVILPTTSLSRLAWTRLLLETIYTGFCLASHKLSRGSKIYSCCFTNNNKK